MTDARGALMTEEEIQEGQRASRDIDGTIILAGKNTQTRSQNPDYGVENQEGINTSAKTSKFMLKNYYLILK